MATDRFVVGMPLGRWQTNCFVVGDRDRGTCVVIDPGEHGAAEVPPVVDRLGVECEAILLTHGHLDHMWAVPELARTFDVPVHLHPADRWLWDAPIAAFTGDTTTGGVVLEQQFGLTWDPPTERLRDLADHDRLELAGHAFTVRHNPGHTPGHVTFLGHDLAGVEVGFSLGRHDVADADILFSGDLIFAGSIGRTDFPRGSMADMARSLADTVLPLEDDTLILSGHGPDTTVGQERATNPFLADVQQRLT